MTYLLTSEEETRLIQAANFLKTSPGRLLNCLVRDQLNYLDQQQTEYKSNPSVCFKVELADSLGLET